MEATQAPRVIIPKKKRVQPSPPTQCVPLCTLLQSVPSLHRNLKTPLHHDWGLRSGLWMVVDRAVEDTPEHTSEPTRESSPEDTLSSALGALHVTAGESATTSCYKKRESTGSVISVNSHTRFESESESDDDQSDERAAEQCTEEQAATTEGLCSEHAPVPPTDAPDWVLERKGRRVVLSGAVASRLYPHQRQGAPDTARAPFAHFPATEYTVYSGFGSRGTRTEPNRVGLGALQR